MHLISLKAILTSKLLSEGNFTDKSLVRVIDLDFKRETYFGQSSSLRPLIHIQPRLIFFFLNNKLLVEKFE